MLNVVELVVCVLIVVTLVFYFFFWNRFFGLLFSLLARFALWNQEESSVWVKLGSIHFSVLTGRILIKDLRYHSSNQTVRIVKGQISWRYWLRRPAEEEDLSHARVIGEDTPGKGKPPLACRVHISLQGFEWFIYNRTAAFDNIVSQLDPDIPITPVPTPVPEGAASVRKIFSRTSVFRDASILGPPVSLVSSIYKRTPTFIKRGVGWFQRQLPNLDPKDLLPISLEVLKGAITIGNASTPNLLAAEFQRGEGTYGIVDSRSKHDHYKSVFNFKFHTPSVSYVENENYTFPMTEIGRRTHEHVNRSDTTPLRHSSYLSYNAFQRVWGHLRLWTTLPTPLSRTSAFMPSGVTHPQTWGRRKQQKSLDEATPLGADFTALEYAIERKILEANTLELLYYADVVGIVPAQAGGQEAQEESPDPFDIGNGDLPPEWGIDLMVRGGFIRYGPWADRQRGLLQHAFFPPTFTNAPLTPRLKPGDMRMWTGMKLFIELRDGVTLQLPFREPSKNWQWDGKVDVKGRPRKREAATIHVRAGDSSTISYIVPMVATAKGFQSVLEVHLDTVTVTSSLNDIRLLTAETCRVRSHMPAPLKWNGLRQWSFAISLRQPCLYLLRDHINMFTDLGKDWSTGPPSDYNTFTPIIYVVDLDLHQYNINLYVNDHNIIDKPSIKEENALLTLRGTHLSSGIHMPFNKYRPEATAVSFWIEAPDVNVDLALPRWNISSLAPTPDRSQVGRIGMLNMKGSYLYFADINQNNVDQLKLDFSVRDPVYKTFGWTIRYLMILRDNYFGSFTHFSTLTEYLKKRESGQTLGDPIHLQFREGQSNAMQVVLGLDLDNGLMILPVGYPGYEKYLSGAEQTAPEDLGPCLFLSLPTLQVHLRSNDYYMEMTANVDTISGRISEHCYNDSIMSAPTNNGREQFVIDGLDIIANRLFGPRPATSTYVCIWEIHVGDVKASVKPYEVALLSSAGSAFGLNFSDPLNAPAKEYSIPSDPDVTFLKIQVKSVNVVWLANGAAAELSLPAGLRLDMNDLAGKEFRKVTSLRLPEGTARLLLASKQDRARWVEAANARLNVDLDIYSAPPGWRDSARKQADFIAEQDRLTGRAKILYAVEGDSADSSRLRPGRGATDTDFYLPQIRIPRMSPTESLQDRLGAHMAPLREDVSESDIDPLPESARDARLADLRPTNIPASTLSDEDTGSGDESDDDDVSDWSTDYEDPVEDDPVHSTWPSANQYSPYCRHYESRLLSRPSSWTSSPFIMTRDVSQWYRSSAQAAFATMVCSGPTLGPDWTSFAREDSESADKDIYRVHSKRGIVVWMTPLILPVMTQLLRDISARQLGPELRMDALTMNYITAFKGRPRTVEAVTCLDIRIPSIEVRSLQLVNAISQHGASQPRDAFATVAEVLLAGTHLRARLRSTPNGQSERDVASAFKSFSITLLSKSPSRQSFKQDPRAQCQLSIGSTLVSTMREQLTVSLGVLSTDIDHSGPDFVFATIVVLAKCLSSFIVAHREIRSRTPSTDQQIVHGILAYSRERSVVDPLSTIQPSYLVQHGLPDRLRKDITFKFLVYLRHSLRFLDEHERLAIQSLRPQSENDASIEDILSTLQSQWFGVGGDDDSSTLSQQSLLQELLHPPSPPPPASGDAWEPPYSAISVTLAGIRLVLRHPTDAAQSSFVAGSNTISLNRQPVDLIQAVAGASSRSYPLSSSRDRERRKLVHLSLCLTLDDISCTVHPQAVEFMQIVLREYRHHTIPLQAILKDVRTPVTSHLDNNPLPSRSVSPSRKPSTTLSLDCTLSMRSFTFTAATEKLIVRFKNADVTYASSLLAKLPSKEQHLWDISNNHSLMFDNATIEACAVTSSAPTKEHVLASLRFSGGRTNVVMQRDVGHNTTLHVFLGLRKLHLEVPRSALRLYRFVEGWRSDYLPGLDATVRALLAEMRGPPTSPHPPPSYASHSPKVLNFEVQASVMSVQATLQVMHGTWLSWEVHETLGFLMNDTRRRGAHLFGLQMGAHVFSISKTRSGTRSDPSSSIRLEFPTITLRGRHDNASVQGLALVDFFHVIVRPSDWDTLLSVQQKSGQDFNDLLHIIEQSRQKQPEVPVEPDRPATSKSPLKFHGLFKMKGFRIGLEGLTTTVFLECDDISGGLGNHSHSLWHIKLSDLALSLASQLSLSDRSDRDRRSAFVRVDFETHMQRKPNTPVPHLEVSVAKVHAVMQPSSIGELGDFIDHLQAEVLIRKEQRASELEEFKEKTRSLMRTLDVKIGEQAASEKSLLELYTISLVITNIGVAFPLSLARDLQMPRSGSHDDAAVRAFLFSIKSLKFSSQAGENGKASMTNFAFQFVSRFRQGVPADFTGESHKTRNRLLYPEMTAEAHSERVAGSRRVCIGAQVSGFVLDVDSTIPDFISSLLDVYRRGKDRVERLGGAISRPSPSTETEPRVEPAHTEAQYGALPTSNILASLTFASGKVRMHSKDSSSQHRRGVLSTLVYGRGEDTNGAEEFNLPEVSVWGEFRATPAVHKLADSGRTAEPSTLIFKSTIHSSQNTLRPTLLPFLTEIMTKVEDHMRSSSWKSTQASPAPRTHGLLPTVALTEELPVRSPHADPVTSMKISFSLRIDQSKLHFTCRPDANVIGGLYWDSGGFIINIAPGARRVSFTGTVGGLTVALKHGFLSEDCVKVNARNLNFSMAFAKVQPTQGRVSSSISVVLDTEFSGSIRFSRFQDVLCFKAVWLDRIPVFTGGNSTPTDRPSNPPSAFLTPQPSSSPKEELTTAVLIRLRRVELDVDLGQSISSIKLTLDDALVRTKITEVLHELSLSIEQLTMLASGNLSGHVDLPNFQFQTVRRNSSEYAKEAGGRMLDLTMTTGVFVVKLDSEYHELIRYRAEPITVYIYDDWSQISSDISADDRRVHLDFVVSGSDVLAIMTVGTVPKLVSYVDKFRMNLDAQRDGASRESQAFRVANAPKPDNPLSTVANAMFRSARSRLKETETGISYVIAQRMSLQLERLQLIVFPRSMRDAELAQFVGAKIHARLQRVIHGDIEPSRRDLRLHFSTITISKISQLRHALVPKDRQLDSPEWLKIVVTGSSEAIIFGLPSMSMHMRSMERQDGTQRVLSYDFKSTFEKAGLADADDIYISLNMALYSWLTVLRKTFAREMEQVQASAEARVAVGAAGGAQAVLSHRKKAHEPTGTSTSPLDDAGTSEAISPLRTRARTRGSISTRTVPLAAHSMDDIPISSSLAPLKISTASAGPSKIVSPISTASSADPTSPSSSGFGPTAASSSMPPKTTKGITYEPHDRKIERLTMRQLGEATPDVMHPFFMKKAGFNLEDSLPQYVHEYATMPTEEMMKALLKLYSKQLTRGADEPPLWGRDV